MDRNQKISLFFTLTIVLGLVYFFFGDNIDLANYLPRLDKTEVSNENPKSKKGKRDKVDSKIGKVIDSYNGVNVFYNGKVSHVNGRNATSDGYNLGLKYQCVEFVKRYYFERFGHKMPNSYGHAKEFYDSSLSDREYNKGRALMQYTNPSLSKPKPESLLIYGPTPYNSFGHVAIITKVDNATVECISQNLGAGNGTRRTYPLKFTNDGRWYIDEQYISGWLSR